MGHCLLSPKTIESPVKIFISIFLLTLRLKIFLSLRLTKDIVLLWLSSFFSHFFLLSFSFSYFPKPQLSLFLCWLIPSKGSFSFTAFIISSLLMNLKLIFHTKINNFFQFRQNFEGSYFRILIIKNLNCHLMYTYVYWINNLI